MPLSRFHPVIERWFANRFATPTEPQRRAWPVIRQGGDVLIAAPTGSGKTFAAFLSAIDALVRQGLNGELRDEIQVVYVSPLKALSNDVQKNLSEPLAEIRAQMAEQGLPDVEVRTLVRTGDTPQSERQAMLNRPPHTLVTTPESLYLILTSERAREMLRSVRTVIVDEIHAVARDKRGSHLALSLARLDALIGKRPQRIGLSATQRPIEEIAQFLVGTGQPLPTIVDAGHIRTLDLALEIPSSPLEAVMSAEVWEEVNARIAELIAQQRATPVRAADDASLGAARRRSRHEPPRQPVTREAARGGGAAQARRAAGARRHRIARAGHRHRQRRSRDPSGLDPLDRHAAAARGPRGAPAGGDSQGPPVPAIARRADRMRRDAARNPRGKARQADHSQQAARHPRPTDRGRRGRRRMGRERPVRAGAVGLPVSGSLAGRVRRRGADAGGGIHDAPRTAQRAHPLRRHQQEAQRAARRADRRDHVRRGDSRSG